MDDIYSALIGAPPSDTEKLAALAKQLRNSNAMGLVAQLSGDRILSPIGKQMQESTNTQAEDLGKRGEQARYRQYQEQASTRGAEQDARTQAWREQNAKDQMAHDLALERLRQSGDLSLERVRQSAKTSDEEKQALKDKKALDAYTVKYGKDLESVGIPAMRTAIGNVDKELTKYEGKNIPGVNIGGGITGLFSKEGRQMRTALQPIQNILLHLRSGAAVTPSEADRLEREMFGAGATDESFRQAWAQIKSLADAQEANINRSYDPSVLENYASHSGRGGIGGARGLEPVNALDSAINPSQPGVPSFEEWKASRGRK